MPFDAFMSYSHASDRRLAPAVQSALQHLAKPWYRRRALRVFRDKTGLAVNPGLWSAIQAALDSSSYFVLLASPEAAASTWVNREVEHWKATKPADHLLPVVTAGAWAWDEARRDFDWSRSTAVPEALRGVFREEPLYLDLRWARETDQLDLRHSRFRDAMAELAAPLHGTTKDELESEDVRVHRRAVRLAWTAALSLVVLTVIALLAGTLAVRNADRAEQRRRDAVSRGLALRSATLMDSRLDAALLLAVEAQQVRATEEARTSLLLGLHHSPGLVTILHRHVGRTVTAVAISPDGSTLASAGEQGVVALGRVGADGSPTTLLGHRDVVWALAYSPDGTLLASAGADASVRLWDLATGAERVAALTGHAGVVDAVAFSPDGRLVASGGWDGTVRLWDPERGVALAMLSGHTKPVAGLLFLTDDTLVSAGWDGTLRRWSVDDRTELGPAVEVGPSVNAVALSPDGTLLATGDNDGLVRLWAAGDLTPLGSLEAHSAPVDALAFSPDGRLLASGGEDKTIWLWDTAARSTVGAPLTGHASWVAGLAFTPDGQTLVSAAHDGTLRVWDVAGSEPVSNQLLGHAGPVRGVAVAADDQTLVVGGDWGTSVWDIGARALRAAALTTDGARGVQVAAVAVAPDGSTFATAGYDGTVVRWTTARLEPAGEPMAGHDGIVLTVAYSPDGRTLASGGRDGAVRLWDVASGQARAAPLEGHTDAVASVAFGPDGSTLASAGWDGTLRLWDLRGDVAVALGKPLTGHRGAVASVAFSPDGRWLASGGFDGDVRLWELDSASTVPTTSWPLTGHTDVVLSLAFSPDGRELASGGRDQTVRVWDTTRRMLVLGPLTGQRGSVTSLAYLHDGRALLSGSEDHTVRFWQVGSTDLEASACAVAGRNLTRDEWAELIGDDAPYRTLCPGLGVPPEPTGMIA